MLPIPIIVILAALLCCYTRGGDINAASASRDDVGTAYASATDGDRVLIPAGTATWTSNLTITNAVSLIGAGTNSTIIKDGVSGSTPFLSFGQTLYTSNSLIVANIQFANDGMAVKDTGCIRWTGINTNHNYIIWSNCFFNATPGPSPFMDGPIGVFTSCTWSNVGGIATYLLHTTWGGKLYGDGSVYEAVDYDDPWGWVVFEDCRFIRTGSHYAICDAYGGARYIVRYNEIQRGWIEAHGLDSSARSRGTRAVASYGNSFTGADTGDYVHNIRSGTGICYSNTVTGYLTAANFIHLDAYRRFYQWTPWGPANGTNEWDINEAGGPFESGTATSGGTLTMTDTTKSWTVNQWRGYSVINKNAATSQNHSWITSNTADTITFNDAGAFGANLSFSAGNSYEFWHVTESMDQPSRGQGSLISGASPSIPGGWNDQVDEPWYEWSNTRDGGTDVDAKSQAPTLIRENEHFYNDTVQPGFVELEYPHPFLSAEGGGETSGAGKGRGQLGTAGRFRMR